MKVYGQEITPLTAAIAKTNLFLNGVKEFQIASGDTLENPAFIENDKLKQFDVVLANPPYSIKQWNRTSFEHDKYGRNFLGTPPQSRADYAFFQHILRSMNPLTGRCAILFPHGVLFRDEEKNMREKLIKSDLIECVIGIGKNLFFNSPMDACIVVCRSNKPVNRKGKILFINAKNDVTRKGNFSFLEDSHIYKISSVYANYEEIDGFSSVASNDTILDEVHRGRLSVALYTTVITGTDIIPPEEAVSDWYKTINKRIDLTDFIKDGD